MKCTELISFLEEAIKEHGDLPIGALNHEFGASHLSEIEVAQSNRKENCASIFMDQEVLGDKFIRIR